MNFLSEPTLQPDLSKAEQKLLDEVANDRPMAALVRSATTVDVGEWFGRGRVVGVCFGDEWVMFAAGRRPFIERVPTRILKASAYNPLTGELVLAPAQEVKVRQLKMSPLEAGRVLNWILSGNNEVAN